MTAGGWIFMAVAWAAILALAGWCVWRLVLVGGRSRDGEDV